MEPKSSIQKHSIIAGVLVCSIFPFFVFSKHYFISLLSQIYDFGIFWNPFLWGILFPLFIVSLFANSAKKISPSLNNITYLKACFQFSFQVSSKLMIILFTIYTIGLLVNGISAVLHLEIHYQIVFSLAIILLLSFLLMILTFISSLIIIKLNQNSQTLN